MTIASISVCATIALSSAQAATPVTDLGGVWEGPLAVGSQSIRIVFRILPDGTAVMDSPDQGARDIPVETPTVEGGLMRLTVPSLGGRFEGRRSDDGTVMTGVLSQGGVTLPLVLTRTTTTVIAPARPQQPMPPYPYRSEEVAFDNAEASGVRLAGTLTLPEGNGPFPAAILISGSGPQDRDETVFGHKPFAVLADALTRRGVAVLRYDDRGTAGSTGDFADATSADFATDADAAFAYLAGRSEIDARRIGLIGHSEGGTIAPLVAQEGVPVAWVVMLAGPAVPGGALLVEQSRVTQVAMGIAPAMIDSNVAIQTRIMRAVAENASSAEATIGAVDAVLADGGLSVEQRQGQARQTGSAWTRWFIAHDPGPVLSALDVPLLAIYGGKDVQVPAGQNAPALSRLKPDAEVVILPNLNHLMQPATTGLPAEYEAIETTIDPRALSTIVDWVAAQTVKP